MARRTEKKDHQKWVPTEFMKLTSDCTFRMFEEDGTPVVDAKGHSVWIAASKPYLDKDGVPTIKTYAG